MTYFYKIVLPRLWIGGFTLVTAMMYVTPDAFDSINAREVRGEFFFALVAGAIFMHWTLMPLMKVHLCQGALVISNFKTEIRVPLSEVEWVSSSILMTPELIWLHLSRSTAFGEKIVFTPPLRIGAGFVRSPIVGELDALVEDARKGLGGGNTR